MRLPATPLLTQTQKAKRDRLVALINLVEQEELEHWERNPAAPSALCWTDSDYDDSFFTD